MKHIDFEFEGKTYALSFTAEALFPSMTNSVLPMTSLVPRKLWNRQLRAGSIAAGLPR